jgi:ABC-type phosphate/phosphonate transport system substrate-binding protein
MREWVGAAVEVEIASSYADLAHAIEVGRVDLAWTPPAVCARVLPSVRSILTVVRYAATSCRAALVVHAASGIRTAEDLAGKRGAWVDPLSTSGHLMALAHLAELGMDPSRLFASQRFAGSYRDALLDVVGGRADVTSVFVVDGGPDATLRELLDIAGPSASVLEVLCTTAPAPFDALVVPLESADSTELEERILRLRQQASPPAMLLEVCRADRFVRAKREEYARFREIVATIRLD